MYHKHLNLHVAEANVVAVSVNCRLAPENPLPIPFNDSWLALQWIASQSTQGDEDWIRNYADLDRVYFGGDSAGANIAHSMAIRIGSENLRGMKLRGIFLNCPYFWGVDPIGDEASHPAKRFVDQLLVFSCPGSVADEPSYRAFTRLLANVGSVTVRMVPAPRGSGIVAALVLTHQFDLTVFRVVSIISILLFFGWTIIHSG